MYYFCFKEKKIFKGHISENEMPYDEHKKVCKKFVVICPYGYMVTTNDADKLVPVLKERSNFCTVCWLLKTKGVSC